MKTPQTEAIALARALGLTVPVHLKREDLHQYGSHKGRSIPLMIEKYANDGIRDFVISSSGNAALVASLAVEQHNKNNPERKISLTAYVGKNIGNEKLLMIQKRITNYELRITIVQTDRPKQQALLYEKTHNAKLLRQSTDDLALAGYIELAEELNKIKNLQAIFIPTSSGTTAQALGQAFQPLEQKPQIHIVQTTACHPIASVCAIPPLVGGGEGGVTRSIATAIVDRVAHRKDKVVEVVRRSHGAGWIVSDDEIKDAIEFTKLACNLTVSPNSALSIAGLKKAAANGFNFSGPVVCLITGT